MKTFNISLCKPNGKPTGEVKNVKILRAFEYKGRGYVLHEEINGHRRMFKGKIVVSDYKTGGRVHCGDDPTETIAEAKGRILERPDFNYDAYETINNSNIQLEII